MSITSLNACSLLGGMGTMPAQLAIRRRKLERFAQCYRKTDIAMAQEVRGVVGAEAELRYYCRQACIHSSFGPRAGAGGLIIVVRPEFRARFDSATFDVSFRAESPSFVFAALRSGWMSPRSTWSRTRLGCRLALS